MPHRHLRAWRKRFGLTQAQLGERLGIGQPLVGKWERGLISPTLVQLAQLAAVYDMPRVSDLLEAPGGVADLERARQAASILAMMPDDMRDNWLRNGQYMVAGHRELHGTAPHLLRGAGAPAAAPVAAAAPKRTLHEPRRGDAD